MPRNRNRGRGWGRGVVADEYAPQEAGGAELGQAPAPAPSTNPAELAQGVQAFRGYNQPQAPPPRPQPAGRPQVPPQDMGQQGGGGNPWAQGVAQLAGGLANQAGGGYQKPPPPPQDMGQQPGAPPAGLQRYGDRSNRNEARLQRTMAPAQYAQHQDSQNRMRAARQNITGGGGGAPQRNTGIFGAPPITQPRPRPAWGGATQQGGSSFQRQPVFGRGQSGGF